MPLNDVKCKNLSPNDKTYKVADEKGLYLEITPKGGKYWRLKYRFAGKEKRLAFGVYPDVSLKEAREKMEIAKKQLANNIDPSIEKKLKKLQENINLDNSFKKIALEWHNKNIQKWKESHGKRILRRLEADVIPEIGFRVISEIKAPELLAVIQKIEQRGALDIARRALQTTGQIFRYAIATGRADRDISADLRGALTQKKTKNHNNLEESQLPKFIQDLESYHGHPQTKLALKFMMLTFVRTTELRKAKFAEINYDTKEWHIPLERMKMGQKHIVPLSKQAMEILNELKKINGGYDYIFPGINKKNNPMSNNTMLFALYRMGYHSKATVHGFRSIASTILNENGWNRDFIEVQLSHSERDKVRDSYNHAKYLKDRHVMMQWWADFLDKMK